MVLQKDMVSLHVLAKNVLLKYKIIPESISIIQNNGLKTLWKIIHNGEIKCLKRLKHSRDKALFTVHAQIHIHQMGGSVPKVYFNQEDNPLTEYEGQLFVLYEWIEGKNFSFGRSSDLRKALEGLARFHLLSKGYVAPEEARVSSKLGRWPNQYESMINRMLKWKEEAANKAQNLVYGRYLQYIDDIINIAHMATEALQSSSYAALTDKPAEKFSLCHQDYGEGNAILKGDSVYILDLDGVTYDLPVRDLRKIIGKRMEKLGGWDKEMIEQIVLWYEKNNTLSFEEKELLKIDLLFPHWYFGAVKNLFKKKKVLKANEIVKAAEFEESKLPVINELFKGGIS